MHNLRQSRLWALDHWGKVNYQGSNDFQMLDERSTKSKSEANQTVKHMKYTVEELCILSSVYFEVQQNNMKYTSEELSGLWLS